MTLRRALHELFGNGSLYYDRDEVVQVYPGQRFGKPGKAYAKKLASAIAYLGDRYCLIPKRGKQLPTVPN